MLRSRRPKLAPIAIVVFWLIMMALLLRHEVFLPFFSSGVPGPRYSELPSDNWMALYLPGDIPAGYVQTQTRPAIRENMRGTQLTVTANVRLQLFGEQTVLNVNGQAWVSGKDGLRDFLFRMRSGNHDIEIAGTVTDGLLDASVKTAGETIPMQWPIGKDLMLWSGLGSTDLHLPDLKPGRSCYIDSFDPVTFTLGKARIECIGEETREIEGELVQTRIITITSGGVTSKAWITDGGEAVRAETPFGFILQKTTPENVLRNLAEFAEASQEQTSPDYGRMSASLVEFAAIRPAGLRPHRNLKRMVVRISGLAEGITPPVDASQQAIEPGLYAIEPVGPPDVMTSEQVETPSQEFLASDAFVQAHHPKIHRMAAEIVQDRSGWEAAQRIFNWVHDSLVKTPVVTVPSALEVLDTREGDCNEHTVLFTALARAAGIPSRIAIGIVWSDELNGFYYHAWPEVFVGEWVWIDPTLGQPVADATHIKLLNGGIEQWTRLLPYLGRLQLEITEAQ